MNETFTSLWALKVLLSLSLSGTLLYLLLILPKPLYRNRLSRCWQYYIWFIVCLRFLLPFTPDRSAAGTIFQTAGRTFRQNAWISQIKADISESDLLKSDLLKSILSDNTESKSNLPSADSSEAASQNAFGQSAAETGSLHADQYPESPEAASAAASDRSARGSDTSALHQGRPSVPKMLTDPAAILLTAWAAAALFCALRRILAYRNFQRFVKTGSLAADPEILNCLRTCMDHLHIQKTVSLYFHPAVTSPVTIGFLHPSIILPSENIEPDQMYLVFLHELTHFKRRDIYYKWFVQAIVCIHWFNPFVHFLEKEINRACELSCDEAVIQTLDTAGRKTYGDTLLTFAKTAGKTRHLPASLTLTEGAAQLKERLGAIMHYKKNSKSMTAAAFLLTACVCTCSIALGAYTAPAAVSQEKTSQSESLTPPESHLSSDSREITTADQSNKTADQLNKTAGQSNKAADQSIKTADQSNTKNERQALTVDDIKRLASKHDALRIDDFSPYIDLSPLKATGSLNELLEFSYNGIPMYIRISASDKDLAYAFYENELDHAVIFCADFLDLDTIEQEYSYKKSCADIRSGNLAHILSGNAQMDDYLTADLPDSLIQSEFKHWIGSHGGVYFTKDGQTKSHTLKNTGLFAQKTSIGGIEIRENGEIAQNTRRLKKLKSRQLSDVTLKREMIKTDQGLRWYAAYTERKDSQISYCLYLNPDEYSEKEFMKISESIQLKDHSIY